jgi:hypothetical protein
VPLRAAPEISRASCADVTPTSGIQAKNLPNQPTQFATLEIDTVSVTEDRDKKPPSPFHFLTVGSKSAADAAFPLRKAAHRSSPAKVA